MGKAPILVTVYNRDIHFMKCIESLKNNLYANESILFIAIDAPSREEDIVPNREIIDYAKNIKGFKDVILFIREKNIGAFQNFTLALEEIFLQSDKLILFEDDNIFSPDFLTFVNKGLDIYQKRNDIFSISGYQFPIAIPNTYKNDIYLWAGFSAWGVGIWRDKWQKIDWNYSNLHNFLNNKILVKKVNRLAENIVPGLKRIIETGHVTGDTLICHHQFVNNMYSIFPIISRVRNIGLDGSGLHSGYIKDIRFSEQVVFNSTKGYEIPFDIKPDKKMYRILKNHFRSSTKSRLKKALKSLLINCRLYKASK